MQKMKSQEKHTSENDKNIEASPKSNEKIKRPKNHDNFDFLNPGRYSC